MTRSELDDLIVRTVELSETLDTAEKNIISSSDEVDTSEITMRFHAMHKIVDSVSMNVRYLDEMSLARDV